MKLTQVGKDRWEISSGVNVLHVFVLEGEEKAVEYTRAYLSSWNGSEYMLKQVILLGEKNEKSTSRQ
jgi:hypothetical protein